MAIKNKKLFLTGVLSVVLIGGGIIVCNNKNASTANFSQEQIKEKDLKTYYTFSGDVITKNSKTIISNNEIKIEEFLVKAGDTVKEGDALFKTTSGNKIKATMDGMVSEIFIDTNVKYPASTQLAAIIDKDSLQVEIKIDEYDINSIKVDDEAEIYINALDKTVEGKVINVSKSAIIENGISYFRGVIEISKTEDILPGMSTEVKIIKEEAKNVKTISINALEFDDDNQPFVYIKGSNGYPIEKAVNIGINDGISVEIKSGIKDSDIVLSKDSNNLNPLEMMSGGK